MSVVVVEQLSELGNKGGVPGVTHSFSDPLLQGSEQKVVSLENALTLTFRMGGDSSYVMILYDNMGGLATLADF